MVKEKCGLRPASWPPCVFVVQECRRVSEQDVKDFGFAAPIAEPAD